MRHLLVIMIVPFGLLFVLLIIKVDSTKKLNDTEYRKNIHFTNMKRLLDDLVVGFDCSTPLNLTSHSYEDINSCEPDRPIISTKTNRMQILQKSSSFTVKAISCSLRRTHRSQYCGNYDHGISLDSDGFTYNTVKLTAEECQRYHEDKETYVGRIGAPHYKERRVKLNIGEENVYQYYKRGKAYPYTDAIGSQISCEGQDKEIGGKTISNIIEHIEDHLTLEVNELVMNEDNIIDKKRNRKLNCKPQDNQCNYGNTIYVWKK